MSGCLCAFMFLCLSVCTCTSVTVSVCVWVYFCGCLCICVSLCVHVFCGKLGGLERRRGKGRNVSSLGKPQLDKSPNPEEADLILGSFLMKGPTSFIAPSMANVREDFSGPVSMGVEIHSCPLIEAEIRYHKVITSLCTPLF